ncbi:MAG: thermonuclease family protein [Proteobacteria bacterium]|nr:thermonuclease family protein [Pseudomonadota bacterium]
MHRLPLAILALALLLPTAALAAITGAATVIDGDTLEIHGQRIHLHGIDAPELGQMCVAEGQRYRCGQEAAFALADKIGRKPVFCRELDVDRNGQIVAVCYLVVSMCSMRENLNAWLVSEGWALAYRRYSVDYIDEEEAARSARRGIWRGEFVPPWEWRRGER